MANISIIERSKGIVYKIKAFNGYAADGKQRTKSISWAPKAGMSEKAIQKELTKVVVEFEKRVEEGQVFTHIKFSEFSAVWQNDYLEKMCSPKYILEAKRMLKTINKEIGHIQLSKLRKSHIQAFYLKLQGEVIVSNKKSRDQDGNVVISKIERHKSGETIRHYHRLISTILTKATQWDYIGNNICLGKGIELPRQKKHEPKFLQDEDVLRLVKCLDKEPIDKRILTMLLLYTGMRIGEALGLEWKDIDFTNNIVSIHRTSQYIEGTGTITNPTKNDSSERDIQVVPELIKLLREYKAWQNAHKLKGGILWKSNPQNTDEKHCDNWNICYKNGKTCYCAESEYCMDFKNADRLFTQYNGIPMHSKTHYQWLKKLIVREGLPDFTTHSLRHTTVSLMIMQGVPLPTIARLVGHSSTATTVKIYSHSIKLAEQMAIESVANIINPSRILKEDKIV